MPIDGITGSVDPTAQAAALAANSTAQKSQTMDSEVFMKLLVTQLRNQDPSSPMDTNQMIGQQTQLAMMEQITNQTTTGNENFSLQMRIAAANLVGKQVSYTDADSGKPVTGTASAVSYANSVPTVTVNGKEVALDVISGITTTAPAS
ncbi:flagellar hook assembly protein FlgD [Curtobacterium flaccumfaciens]|jgi:flagellar basal-body rod modification protein FlgD|uniref:flagellar hook assembly protein FlgD n=1 Tax=Curtobacterium flaccumfaciens TaxID=2035 RepID=UPI001266A66A|nr:flagellar hook capping FlgD N-terminal domain-containing protein [Curtobacterium flaccumfaciens]MBO9048735.1 flagellar hook capping protein [Curtobacterium flaccumfaciens pv. flaccumfaciens]MBO9049892.1 flagellar hook capping protein [Curtobacterium flaccumfaciens pv. flaccumfaciens]MBO9058869.1 flagellar hook capping protein [Curtobacterium flaccumfaciens pv. flaccumfaciens]MBT1664662.1 flagellar hook capping protein [Curtobacterium flaccumfaciens pv. flaccumfaciens]MCS6546813.1 flagellar 